MANSAVYDEENAVLLPSNDEVHTLQMAGTGNTAPKQWRGKLLCCFSGCDLPAWGSVGFFYLAPCVLFGFNMKKALKLSVVWQSLIFFVLFVMAAAVVQFYAGQARVFCNEMSQSTGSSTHISPECKKTLAAIRGSLFVMIVLACIGTVYAARRRTEIRTKFGIAGSRLGDVCTWFWCAGPALCQEARTLWHNNVNDGVWFGPTEFRVTDAAATLPYSAPTVKTMPEEI